jgi:hypothetical protein
VQFVSAAAPAAKDVAAEQAPPPAAGRQLGAESADKDKDKKGDDTSGKKPQPAVPNMNQVAAMAQAAQPLTQGMQSMMSSLQGMGSSAGGASQAKLADDTKKDDTKTTDDPATQLVDATTKEPEGAASGQQGSHRAPVAPADSRPQTGRTETGV